MSLDLGTIEGLVSNLLMFGPGLALFAGVYLLRRGGHL